MQPYIVVERKAADKSETVINGIALPGSGAIEGGATVATWRGVGELKRRVGPVVAIGVGDVGLPIMDIYR